MGGRRGARRRRDDTSSFMYAPPIIVNEINMCGGERYETEKETMGGRRGARRRRDDTSSFMYAPPIIVNEINHVWWPSLVFGVKARLTIMDTSCTAIIASYYRAPPTPCAALHRFCTEKSPQGTCSGITPLARKPGLAHDLGITVLLLTFLCIASKRHV